MLFNFVPTGIGSLPHSDAAKASELVLKYLKNIPFWPQLPRRSYLENMGAQFAEGLPNVIIDEPGKKMFVDTTDIETGLADFYQHFLDDDIDYFAISPDRAAGFHAMYKLLETANRDNISFIKGQVTGPITFGALLTDKSGTALMHHPELADALNKCLIMKARWQMDRFNRLGLRSIIFLDEPYLMGYGSAYVPLSKETVIERISELANTIHNDNGLVGIHCCGNTDWSVILATPVDILNFDGLGFMNELMLYGDDLKKFLSRGGIIAWGMVPSTELDKPVAADYIISKLEAGLDALAKKGIDRELIAGQSILTPACGLGALIDINQAEKRLELLVEVSSRYVKKSAH
ncbi:MAG: methionine synthase [Planctomycetota bacterium]